MHVTDIFQIKLSQLETAPTFANRVIDPDQLASHFRPMAVDGDESSYPGMIYPWLGTLRLHSAPRPTCRLPSRVKTGLTDHPRECRLLGDKQT